MKNQFHLRKNALILLYIFTLPVFSIGQTKSNVVKISPKWKVGDIRDIHVEYESKVSFNDSLIRNSKENYEVHLKVVAIQPQILFTWSSTNDLTAYQFNKEIADTSLLKTKLLEFLVKAEEEVLKSERKLQMDPKTGKIDLWVNGLELVKNAEYHQKKIFKHWCVVNEISPEDRVQIELEFSKKINRGYQIWKEIVLTQANSIFTSYQMSFAMNKTIKENVFTRNLLQLNDNETEFPGVMTKEATEVNDKLILNKKIDFNKEFVASYLRKTSATFKDLSANDVIIYENEQSIFDLKTGWLLSHTKKMHFEVKGMKTTTRTTISFI